MLDKQKKKELATNYKQTFRAMGVYQIRNTQNDKIFVNGSMDLDGMKNRLEFCKQMNTNTFNELQKDWATFGGQVFVFEVLDRIEPRDEIMLDAADLKSYRSEVDALLELWLEKLEPYDDKGYNKRKR
ncbi:GIY-YIG nuclease family protein [Paenibacillus sp. LMG 31461]|uniref:GIY-YIG nuclease family protein n=1 Tax=Paenibacillus plantarum TaxID=2654975 RepID=A0ABX1XJD7_9BACL|nr:GIY-YIG nuclease family protein [Paenibacillus plantarum]NOU68598.1 GIY-YIG nuclease family protein [Paenibacillus plantarum]